jgi:hypothetical protein
MYGTGKLKLYAKEGINSEQVSDIEAKLNNDCPGYEITKQSSKEMVIEGLNDIKEIDMDKIVSRLRALIEEEFKEAVDQNPKTIKAIEKRVNRFYMMGMRYINIIQPNDYTRHIGILNMLEQISDTMDEMLSNFKIKPEIFELLHKQFGLCFEGFAGNEKCIEEVAALREAVAKKLENSRMDKLQRYFMMGISNNILNIAEYGLRVEKPQVKY